jgi:hypothetical protein
LRSVPAFVVDSASLCDAESPIQPTASRLAALLHRESTLAALRDIIRSHPRRADECLPNAARVIRRIATANSSAASQGSDHYAASAVHPDDEGVRRDHALDLISLAGS